MKSMARYNQGQCGAGRGMSLPAGKVRGTFVCAQAVQEETNHCTSINMLGH